MLMNRLRASDGATILIALLFFLLCAVAGSIILTAGTAASGRSGNLMAEEQSYHSVISAANLLQDQLEGKQIDGYVLNGGDVVQYYKEPDTKLKEILETGYEYVFITGQPFSDKLTIKSEDVAVRNRMGIVVGKLLMDSEYNITIVLTVEGQENSYSCVVSAPASIFSEGSYQTDVLVENNTKYIRTRTNLVWSGVKIKAME